MDRVTELVIINGKLFHSVKLCTKQVKDEFFAAVLNLQVLALVYFVHHPSLFKLTPSLVVSGKFLFHLSLV